MPATGTFRLRLGNLAGTILRVDSRVGTTLTVTPEEDDGNADAGATVSLVVTAGAMEQLKADAIAGGGSGGSPRIFQNGVDAPTTGTVAETLYTYTLPGGTLVADGDALRITVGCRFAANGNNKSVIVNFGATGLVATGQAGFNNSRITLVADVVRLTATTQKSLGRLYFSTSAAVSALGGANTVGTVNGNISSTAPAETLSGAVVIAFRALSPTAAGDIVGMYMFVDYYPAP